MSSRAPAEAHSTGRQQRLLAQIEECQSRAARIQEAVLGEKFLVRVIQSSLELSVGDDLLEKLRSEIVVEDGIVMSIAPPKSA